MPLPTRRADGAVTARAQACGWDVFTSDTFYGQPPEEMQRLGATGHLAVEMEAAGLFGVAATEGVAAAAILTVSDHLGEDTHLSPEERQVGFSTMAVAALGAIAGAALR